jgi:Flp pilus assembly protein TadG
MFTLSVFVIDKRKKPLMPCSEKRARQLLERRRAVVHRMYPFTIRLKDRVGGDVQPVRVTIDPGSKTTGLAVIREHDAGLHVLCLAEIGHRGHAVAEGMEQRSARRRRRRTANLRYREPRFDNRRRPEGWLTPSMRSRVSNVLTWVARLRRLVPVAALSQELVKFDLQKEENPEIAGIAYQQGTLAGYELRVCSSPCLKAGGSANPKLMILTGRTRRRSRRGQVAPLLATMMVFLLGMLAFSVDLGRMAVCRAQLQNAADSAALAGASALGTDNLIVTYQAGNQTNDVASARARAQDFAQANSYDLNSSIAIQLDQQNDVTFGTLSTPGVLSSGFGPPGTTPFNSVSVQTNIDASHGGNLNFLFAPVLGQISTALRATATATVELHPIASMKAISGVTSPILPLTMSLPDWQQMVGISGPSLPDNFKLDPGTGLVVPGQDGLPEQQLYPRPEAVPEGSSYYGGIQFGTGGDLSAGVIETGPTSGQMMTQWPPNGTPPPFPFTLDAYPDADPDVRTSILNDLVIGQIRLIPINDGTPPGDGADGSYTIVAFAAVRIMTSDAGSAMVQQAVINDPTLIPDSKPVTGPPGPQDVIPVVRLTR